MSDSYILVRCKTHNRGQNPLPYRLQQYSKDSSGRLAVRELTKAGDEIIAGGWSYSPRPFQPGIYCAHCLADGKREPLDIDELDMKEAGVADTPLVFQIAKEFSAQEALEILQSRFAPSIRLAKILPAVEGRVVPDSVLSQVHSGLQQAIRSKITNGNGLFEFQSRAIELALQRKDLIVTTPTASGKSLTYVVPILDRLLKDQTATALYLSPLTALTSDQLDAISRLDSRNTDWVEKAGTYSIHASLRKVWFDNGAVEVARYDGQVLQGDRDEIRRRQPQWLMTTPDMLHWGLLRNAFSEKTWGYFFKNLSIVVIDEMHTYRGLLGASFANLMRRLERICHKYGVVPQFISTSATIVEPAATMQRLTGRWPMVVDGDNRGAPQTERAFVMMAEPPAEETPRQLSTQAKDMLLHFMKERVRTLAFSRSIDEINTVYRFTKAELKGLGMSNVELTPFKAELNPADKKVILQRLKNGALHGVISTSALSMGIDIGSLSAVVIAGFPGSIAMLWQQAGRAGRTGRGVIVLLLDRGPLDQFFANHPEILFDMKAESIYLNPDNPYVVRNHLAAALLEMTMTRQEAAAFSPGAAREVDRLIRLGIITEAPDATNLTLTDEGKRLYSSTPFRNLSFSIEAVDEKDKNTVVTVDSVRAQRVLHYRARYQNIDTYYEVVRFDVDYRMQRGTITLHKLEETDYTTEGVAENRVEFLEPLHPLLLSTFTTGAGKVQSHTEVQGYYKFMLYTRNVPPHYQPLGKAAPPPIDYESHGLWLVLATEIFNGRPSAEIAAILYSTGEAIRQAIAVEELCDPVDLALASSIQHPQTNLPTIVVFDAVAGGIGITEAAFKQLNRVMKRALLILKECPYCSTHPESRGCPYCVTARYGAESSIDRLGAIRLLDQLVKEHED